MINSTSIFLVAKSFVFLSDDFEFVVLCSIWLCVDVCFLLLMHSDWIDASFVHALI